MLANNDPARSVTSAFDDNKSELTTLRAQLAAVTAALREWSRLADHLNLSTVHHRDRTRALLSTPNLAALAAEAAARDLTRESGLLAQVEAALERMASGTYSICDDCGEEIYSARLAAVPYALRCKGCEEEFELAMADEKAGRLGDHA